MNMIVSCEHAGNKVPEAFAHLFKNLEDVLQSHRGWDPGAAELAKFLATECNSPFFCCETTRLLIEPNRSLHSHQLYSEYSRILFDTHHDHVLREYYYPYRNGVEDVLKKMSKPVLHLSIHTFTPVWEGQFRAVDLGLLYDPDRSSESTFVKSLYDNLEQALPSLSIKLNEPYKGTDDGFTTYLRTQFPSSDYIGIEIEVNQKYIATSTWEMIAISLRDVLMQLLYTGD